jgi:3-hydroxybutyryl-CoA dehydrogenase
LSKNKQSPKCLKSYSLWYDKKMKKLQDVKKVAVIGGGNMGSGIAMVFASAGYSVGLYSRKAETLQEAMEVIKSDLTFLAQRGLGKPEDIEGTLARLKCTQDMAEAINGADFVVECVAEDMALKQDIFKQLDAMCGPDVVLATNTSVMSPTEIASKSVHRERILATHWWNPPFLLPLVEVVQAQETADWVVSLTMDLHRAIGKRPVHVKKDVPGFVANRLQHALKREAISIVERGIADAQTVDESIKYSFGMRLPVVSTLENSDLVGLDLTLSIHEYLLKHLEDSHEPSPLLKEKVAKGELGFKTGGVGFKKWTPEEQEALRNNMLEDLTKRVLEMRQKEAE